MRIEQGNLWDWWEKGWKIVVSTNIGWGTQAHWATPSFRTGIGRPYCETHSNNMGAGIALEAMRRWPWLPEWLGSHYRARYLLGAQQLPVEHDALRLIFVPVKPLKENDPAYSWNQPASLELIALQLGMLSHHNGKIALGFVGCGNGAADPKDVLPMLLKLEIVRQHQGRGETIVVDRQAT